MFRKKRCLRKFKTIVRCLNEADEVDFSKGVTDCGFHRYFPKISPRPIEHFFSRKALNDCFHWNYK